MIGPGIRPETRPPPDPDGRFWPAVESEPPSWSPEAFRQLAVNAAAFGASDITLQSDRRVTLQVAGRQLTATRRPLTGSEVEGLLTGMYGLSSAASLLAQAKVLDFSWEVPLDRTRRRRFRVNATAILSRRGGTGCEVSLRTLPDRTPSLQDVGLSPADCRILSPSSGLVVVAGSTGQGKSTTLAAIVGWHLQSDPVKIVDIQAPIEFTYSDLQHDSASSIGQSEVGIHVRSFADGIRSALRRSPRIIMVGEVRDPETARAAVDAALTGHLVYTTLHAGDVPEIFHRLHALLASGGGGSRTAEVDIIQTLRVGLAQRLLRSAKGLVRHPVREIAAIDGDLRTALRSAPPDEWQALVSRALGAARPGDPCLRPFRTDIEELLSSGRITADGSGEG